MHLHRDDIIIPNHRKRMLESVIETVYKQKRCVNFVLNVARLWYAVPLNCIQ